MRKLLKKIIGICFGLIGSVCMFLHTQFVYVPEVKVGLFVVAIFSSSFFVSEISELFTGKSKVSGTIKSDSGR